MNRVTTIRRQWNQNLVDCITLTPTNDVISQETQPVDCAVVVVFIFILVDGEGYLHLHAPAEIKAGQMSISWTRAEQSAPSSNPRLPFGAPTGAQLSVEVEQTVVACTQQGGGRREADVQGGGAYLHHQQLTAETTGRSVQSPLPHWDIRPDLKFPRTRRCKKLVRSFSSLHFEVVVAVDSSDVPHHNPVIVRARCDTVNHHVTPSHSVHKQKLI